ncbi:MAG: RagB/SusD family nutrient uptake outer membrane protein, partial [Bacteroidetes bacterium]|nr:RagB/SusD family nutrient uptake outer membrane protein [Bacteroidota bacterium]
MKNLKIIPLVLVMFFITISCSEEFLNVSPPGSYSEPSLQNAKGVEGMLIAAYSALDGSWFESWGNNHFNQQGGASNWMWGSVRSDVAYKGTEQSDGVDLNPIERAEAQPSNPTLNNKWNACYDGIGKANAALKNLVIVRTETPDDISDADATRIEAEARVLRGHFHFEAVKVFGRAAYVDENVTDFAAITNPPAGEFIWADLENDFKFGYDNLPGTMSAPGRVNKYVAGAFLAKVYMWQGKWSEAEAVLDDIVNNGTTSSGDPLELTAQYHHNFRADLESGNTELMFGYEAAYGDGSISNGNYENTLNQPHGSSARTACCGFFQPSQNLANSFKTDAAGLPLLDTYNDVDILSDEGAPARSAWNDTLEYKVGDVANVEVNNQDFAYIALTDNKGKNPQTSSSDWELKWTEDLTTSLDPRVDWTIGRRSVPFLDWGVNPGSTSGYVRNVPNGGIYNPVKTVPTLAEFDAQLAGVIDWGFTSTAKNVHIIRFADVLLLAAEVKAELGKLDEALNITNMV